jgi:UTP--glucose-1-phosphate uridylyltransferase
MKAVILCGGLATRMLPISKSVPKEMMPVANKPVLDYIVDDLVENGVKDILIITNRGKECIENYYDLNPELNARLLEGGKNKQLKEVTEIATKANMHFIRQITPLGTGHALKRAESFVGNEPFLFLFGDELLYNPSNNLVKQLINAYNKCGVSVVAATTCPIEESYKYGMMAYEGEKLKEIVEKPQPENSPSNVCNLGNSLLTPDVFKYIKLKEVGETGVVDAINECAKVEGVNICMVEGERIDVGSKAGLIKANIYYGLQDAEIKDEIKEYLKTVLNNL